MTESHKLCTIPHILSVAKFPLLVILVCFVGIWCYSAMATEYSALRNRIFGSAMLTNIWFRPKLKILLSIDHYSGDTVPELKIHLVFDFHVAHLFLARVRLYMDLTLSLAEARKRKFAVSGSVIFLDKINKGKEGRSGERRQNM
jgi:hypothetical protein